MVDLTNNAEFQTKKAASQFSEHIPTRWAKVLGYLRQNPKRVALALLLSLTLVVVVRKPHEVGLTVGTWLNCLVCGFEDGFYGVE